jgi:hypothetical protein
VGLPQDGHAQDRAVSLSLIRLNGTGIQTPRTVIFSYFGAQSVSHKHQSDHKRTAMNSVCFQKAQSSRRYRLGSSTIER